MFSIKKNNKIETFKYNLIYKKVYWYVKKQFLYTGNPKKLYPKKRRITLQGKEQLANNKTCLFFGPLHSMEPQFIQFKENVDAWIKQIRREFSELSDLPAAVLENTENIQHNYELIYELKDEIDELKQEINALKLIQIIALKNQSREHHQMPNAIPNVDKVNVN